MPYSGQLRLYLHSLPQHRIKLHLTFSGSYHADTVRHRWISDQSSQVLPMDPAVFLQWMSHFSVQRQTSGILPMQAYLPNIRKLLLHLQLRTALSAESLLIILQ